MCARQSEKERGRERGGGRDSHGTSTGRDRILSGAKCRYLRTIYPVDHVIRYEEGQRPFLHVLVATSIKHGGGYNRT